MQNYKFQSVIIYFTLHLSISPNFRMAAELCDENAFSPTELAADVVSKYTALSKQEIEKTQKYKK